MVKTSGDLNNIESKLKQLREKIDSIDSEIKKSLASRVDIVVLITEIKNQLGSSTFDSEREKFIYNRISSGLEGDKLHYVQSVFERIIDESRTLQRKLLKKSK